MDSTVRVLKSRFTAELASRDHTIGELQGKLLLSEQLATEQALQLAESRSARIANDAEVERLKSQLGQVTELSSKMTERFELVDSDLGKAFAKAHKLCRKVRIVENELHRARGVIESLRKHQEESRAEIKQLKEHLEATTVELERHSQAGVLLNQELSHMQKQLEDNQQVLAQRSGIIKNAEGELRAAHANVASLQEQLDEALALITDLQEQLNVTTAEKEGHSQAEVRLRQEVDTMKQQLQSNEQMLAQRSEAVKKLEQKGLDLRRKLEKKESQFTHELTVKDEMSYSLFRALKTKQRKVKSQEYALKLLEEQKARCSSMRTELEKKCAAMEAETVRLKHELRKYAEIIVGNDGEPFYEVRPAQLKPTVSSKSAATRDPTVSKKMPMPTSQDMACKLGPSRLPHRDQTDPVRPEIASLVGRHFKPIQQQLSLQQLEASHR